MYKAFFVNTCITLHTSGHTSKALFLIQPNMKADNNVHQSWCLLFVHGMA